MWMGGTLPLGYNLPEVGTRTLRVNDAEAATVRHIFARYLELGSVHALEREFDAQGIRSKLRTTSSGKTSGGTPFSRGALFHLLRNRIYLGQIVHRELAHPGEHEAIVDAEVFARVQHKLDNNARRHRAAAEHRIVKAPLTGKLFDAAGEPMTLTFSRGKSGRTYRYYVSASLQQGCASVDDGTIRRVSAPALETMLTELVTRWLGPEHSLAAISSVRFGGRGLLVDLPASHAPDLAAWLTPGETILHTGRTSVRVEVVLALPQRGGKRHIVAGDRTEDQPDSTLIAALRKAHWMTQRERGIPVVQAAPTSAYDRMILRLAFLAPDI